MREAIDMAQLERNIARGEVLRRTFIRHWALLQLEQNGWDIQTRTTRDRLINHHPDDFQSAALSLSVGASVKILPKERVQSTKRIQFFQPNGWGILAIQIALSARDHMVMTSGQAPLLDTVSPPWRLV